MPKRQVKSIDGFEKELLSETERVELFISKYWSKIAIVSVILVVVIVGIFAFSKSRSDAQNALMNKFASAEGAELEKLIADNSSATGVEMARLRLAAELVQKKDFAGAAKHYALVAESSDADIQLRQVAALAQGSALEQDKKLSDAAAVFTKVADNAAFSAGIKAQAGCQAARLLIAEKKFDAAKALLQRIVARKGAVADDFAFLTWISQAEQTLTALENGDFAPAKAAVKPAKKAEKAKPAKK